MRRVAVCLVLALTLVIAGAGGALAQDGSPDIIPDPTGPARPSNTGGLIVVLLLVTAWLVGGAVLLVRARNRRNSGP